MFDNFDFRKWIGVRTSDRAEFPLAFDAWNRPKTILDYSLFHGVFIPEIPSQMWIEEIDTVEQLTFVNFSSENGMLKCSGTAGQQNFLMSKRHPRYQPNRGHLYSTSIFLPDFASASIFEFGMFHHQGGILFRATNSTLYAVRQTLKDGVKQEFAEQITVPSGIDLTKGNNYDIHMQWRGAGNIQFFINSKLVHTMKLISTLTEVSVFNPALPIGYQVTGVGTMYSGCVDVSSEGGKKETRARGTSDTGEIPLSNAEIPAILIYLPNAVNYNGVNIMNTRDIALRRITGYADDNTLLKVYSTRNGAKFAGTTFTDYDTLASVKYSHNGNITLVGGVADLRKLSTRRISANGDIEIENPDPESGEFWITHGDYILVTMQAKNSTFGGASIEWGVEA